MAHASVPFRAGDLRAADLVPWAEAQVRALRDGPRDVFEACFRPARLAAPRDTGIGFTLLPDAPPFTTGRALNPGLPPKRPDPCDHTR